MAPSNPYVRRLSVDVIAETGLPAPYDEALVRDLRSQWLVGLLYSRPNILHLIFL